MLATAEARGRCRGRSWWPPVSPQTAGAECSGSRSYSEEGAFWTASLRSLKIGGLTGTKLVTSDAHAGLIAPIAAMVTGAAWQRCPVHFSALRAGPGPQGIRGDEAAAVRTIVAQPDAKQVREQLEVIVTMLGRQFHNLKTALRGAAEDITAFADFPVAHCAQTLVDEPARAGQ